VARAREIDDSRYRKESPWQEALDLLGNIRMAFVAAVTRRILTVNTTRLMLIPNYPVPSLWRALDSTRRGEEEK
jgi:hypothetical protein